MRLIDADALMKHFATSQALVNDRDVLYCNGVLDVISREPSVDAVTVVHGRWVRSNDEQAYFDVEYVCSGCQFVVAVSGIGTPILYGYKYCPNCGLPMDAKDMDAPTKDGGTADG